MAHDADPQNLHATGTAVTAVLLTVLAIAGSLAAKRTVAATGVPARMV